MLKAEHVHQHTFHPRRGPDPDRDLDNDFYNTRRLHSVCGWKRPIGHEHGYWASPQAAACSYRPNTGHFSMNSVVPLKPSPKPVAAPGQHDHPADFT
ncbi:hypothetical protein ACWDHW_47530 [Streptomyces melanosporofaciens]|uniref:hypothetical protein n=1 Tax=unclassified Streptomyces TaxID=2593676 RepID=UPI0036B1BA4C